MLKILFHFYNLLLIILYIYPGSILGFLVYKDLSRQPQITSDFFSISSNHLYVFILLSLLGLLSIIKKSVNTVVNRLEKSLEINELKKSIKEISKLSEEII